MSHLAEHPVSTKHNPSKSVFFLKTAEFIQCKLLDLLLYQQFPEYTYLEPDTLRWPYQMKSQRSSFSILHNRA